MFRPILICFMIVTSALVSAHAQNSGFGPAETAAATRLTAKEKAGKLVIHFEPTDWMKHILPEFKKNQLQALKELEQRLAIKFRGPIHIFTYLTDVELREVTGASPGTAAYASGRFLHTPFHTLPHHEMTHILCTQWNDRGNAPVKQDRKLTDYSRPQYKFVVEGFADAMTHMGKRGIPIRQWVAYYERLGEVPSLTTLRQGFPKTGSLASGYWISGSFFEFLIEKYGMKLVKRYYFRPESEKSIFGKTFVQLAKSWRTWLRETEFDMEKVARTEAYDAVVFEKTVRGAKGKAAVAITADDRFFLWHNGTFVGEGRSWMKPKTFSIQLVGKDSLRVLVLNSGGAGGLLLQVTKPGGKRVTVSDSSWAAKRIQAPATKATVLGKPLDGVWGHFATPESRAALQAIKGKWIWLSD